MIIVLLILAGIFLYAASGREGSPEASHQWEIVAIAGVLFLLFGGYFHSCTGLNVLARGCGL